MAGLELRAKYYFRDDALSQIAIPAPYRRCQPVVEAMLARYGDPLIVSDQVILKLIIWHDVASDTRPVLMLSSAGICDLTLYPLAEYRDNDLAEVAAGRARPPR